MLTDRKSELALLIQAIDELKNLGEVKITEWIRGGNVAWMQNIVKLNPSAYGKSPHGPLDTRERYQYPGWHSSSVGNVLY